MKSMLDPALLNENVELLAANFKPDEINHLGKLLFKEYDSHKLSGTDNHITLSSRRCADVLVNQCGAANKTLNLIKLIADLEESSIFGREVRIEGLEIFLNNLARAGLVYDPDSRRFVKNDVDKFELVNWGSLRSGRSYEFTVMSLDIVGNSKLVKKYGSRAMEKLYYQFRMFLVRKVSQYDGRFWGYAGDGCLIAFTFKHHADRAVKCAVDIQLTMPLFNIDSVIPIEDHLTLRMAMDTGRIRFMAKTGTIVSEVINYAAHLEKSGTEPGGVSISDKTAQSLNSRVLTMFEEKHPFEGRVYYATSGKIEHSLNG